MRFVKPLIIAVLVLFVILSLISLLMPANVRLLRSVTIYAPKNSIQLQVSKLENWPNWQTFLKEPSLKFTVATNGQSAYWEKNGKRHVVRKMESALNESAFVFSVNGSQSMEYYFSLLEIGGAENVQLQCAISLHTRWYPWERFSGLLFEQAAGPGIEAALQDLKLICEN
jgi:hypothetical protein